MDEARLYDYKKSIEPDDETVTYSTKEHTIINNNAEEKYLEAQADIQESELKLGIPVASAESQKTETERSLYDIPKIIRVKKYRLYKDNKRHECEV